jgi:hypothetical protein
MEFNFPTFSTNSTADEDDEEEDDDNDSKSLRDDQESRATTTPIFLLLFLRLLMLLLQLATDTLELSHSLLPRPQEEECATSNNLEEGEEEAGEECSLLLLLTRLTDMLLSLTRIPRKNELNEPEPELRQQAEGHADPKRTKYKEADELEDKQQRHPLLPKRVTRRSGNSQTKLRLNPIATAIKNPPQNPSPSLPPLSSPPPLNPTNRTKYHYYCCYYYYSLLLLLLLLLLCFFFPAGPLFVGTKWQPALGRRWSLLAFGDGLVDMGWGWVGSMKKGEERRGGGGGGEEDTVEIESRCENV